MNTKKQKQNVRSAFNSTVIEPFEYLKNISNTFVFNGVIENVNTTCRDREKIAWNCVSCQRPILMNIVDFTGIKQTDYLCDGCKDNIITNALALGILKSSNNLRLLIQARIYKNYDKKSILS